MTGSPADPSRLEAIAEWRRLHAEAWVKVVVSGAAPEQNARAEGALLAFWPRHGISAIEGQEAAFAIEGLENRGCFRLPAFAPEDAASSEDEAYSAAWRVERQRRALDCWQSAHALAWIVATGTEYRDEGVALSLQYDRAAFDAVCRRLWPWPIDADDCDYPEQEEVARYQAIAAEWNAVDSGGRRDG